MLIENIHNTWGSRIILDRPDEFFNYDSDYWKSLLYNRYLLVFKCMDFSIDNYYNFSKHFGTPHSYNNVRKSRYVGLHKFSNKVSHRLGEQPMPWHADISNDRSYPFPVRTLWMANNPNPAAGVTGFMNLVDSIDLLTEELKYKLNDICIIQQEREDQSVFQWKQGMNEQEFGIIKTHPISKKQSLRLNFYNTLSVKNSWIGKVKINGNVYDDCSIIGEYIDYISVLEDMTYFHKWDTHDILVMDNWNLLHNRTQLNLPAGTERVLYRVDVVHEY